ncbi:hypothetical protein [Rickettsia endosymbiont of Halotydeus destructor]|uniref:hypothetical protein n=1 Tax=Rickettsia endosymbiont of Halotydeus destructor TaxID=2996754 RepID=UPI003BAF0BD7
MSFVINVNSNIKYIERYMDILEKKQLPFGTTLALNKIALLSQDRICKAIPRIFNNSRNWWDRRQRTGIKVQFATKYVRSSAVYTKAHFANIQEEGGIKRPYSGKLIAVPTANVPRKARASNALRKEEGNKNVFKLGNSIYKRLPGSRLQRLYSLTPKANIKARFGFKDMAVTTFNKHWDRVFTESFNYALNTAK